MREKHKNQKKTGIDHLTKGQEGAATVGKDVKTLAANKTKPETTSAGTGSQSHFESDSQCSPNHVYSKVSLIVFNGSYPQDSVDRIAAFV